MAIETKTVYLVRHGSTTWNEEGRICGHRELPLSERGKGEAQGAEKFLSPCPIDHALTSPLTRTAQTAEIILTRRSVRPQVDQRLIELKLRGWEGEQRQVLIDDPLWQQWISAPHKAATPEGERLQEIQVLVVSCLNDGLRQIPSKGELLIVSHGGVLRVLLLHLLEMPLSAYHKVRIDCGSVTAIDVDNSGKLKLLRVVNLSQPTVGLSRHSVE